MYLYLVQFDRTKSTYPTRRSFCWRLFFYGIWNHHRHTSSPTAFTTGFLLSFADRMRADQRQKREKARPQIKHFFFSNRFNVSWKFPNTRNLRWKAYISNRHQLIFHNKIGKRERIGRHTSFYFSILFFNFRVNEQARWFQLIRVSVGLWKTCRSWHRRAIYDHYCTGNLSFVHYLIPEQDTHNCKRLEIILHSKIKKLKK